MVLVLRYRGHRNYVALDEDDYGFGEFKCHRCNVCWQSTRAWSAYYQKCKHCAAKIKPSSVERLFQYRCSDCDRNWQWKWEEHLPCRSCRRPVKPFKDHKEFQRALEAEKIAPPDFSDLDSPHRPEHCEKCQLLGSPCWLQDHLQDHLRDHLRGDDDDEAVAWRHGSPLAEPGAAGEKRQVMGQPREEKSAFATAQSYCWFL